MVLDALLGALALLLVAGVVYQITGAWRDRRRFPPPGRIVRFNHRRMHIHETGGGTPTVVFESGMGASCLSWTLVQPQVAQFTRAVSYDRAQAAHGSADRAGAAHAAGCHGCARAICSRWALVRRICEPGVRAPLSQ